MKKYILTIMIATVLFLTGCGIKNNTVSDNNDGSDLNPTDNANVAYQTTICRKDEDKNGVTDKTTYEIKHDGQNVKNITMKMHYELTDETNGKNVFDNNKSIFTDIKDAFVDAVNITTNVVEDSANLYRANIELAVDKMSDEDMTKFDKFKVSKDLNEQKRHFEDDGYTCD